MPSPDRPLEGVRVLVTRPIAQSRGFSERLRRLGAVPVAYPTIAVAAPADSEPLDRALQQWSQYAWIVFTSANGVRSVTARMRALGLTLPAGPRVAAIGPATAAALRRRGWRTDAVPAEHRTDAIPAALGEVAGLRILLPRAAAASPGLPRRLRERGAVVDDVVAYRTTLPRRCRAPLPAVLAAERIGVITFTSPSTVRNFLTLLGPADGALRDIRIACIGPVTAAAAADAGLRVDWVAADYTTAGLVGALVNGARRAAD